MKNNHGKFEIWTLIVLALLVIGGGAYFLFDSQTSSPVGTGTATTTPSDTHGMVQYTDTTYGFTFWYPSSWQVLSTVTKDTVSFPGGTLVKTFTIGPTGGVMIYVVDSPAQTITDEQNGHASPIAQTKYFYDSRTQKWMVAYSEGTSSGAPSATTTATISNTTVSGLIMLPSGRRFDTSIIPLSTATFLVVSSGGGDNATPLAKTISLVGDSVEASILSAALQAEAQAYTKSIGGSILPYDSGIRGVVLAGPTCPVQRMPPDPSCADKPVQTTISIYRASDTTHLVATLKSSIDGTFQTALPPGEYVMKSGTYGVSFPRCSDSTTIVKATGYTKVTISCDTGIR